MFIPAEIWVPYKKGISLILGSSRLLGRRLPCTSHCKSSFDLPPPFFFVSLLKLLTVKTINNQNSFTLVSLKNSEGNKKGMRSPTLS